MKLFKYLLAIMLVSFVGVTNAQEVKETKKEKEEHVEFSISEKLKKRKSQLLLLEKRNAVSMDRVQKVMKKLETLKESNEISEEEYTKKMEKVSKMDKRIKQQHDNIFKLQSDVLLKERELRRIKASR